MQIYVHIAYIMQCINGKLECIKPVQLRAPGLRACIRGPRPQAIRPPRRACVQAAAPDPPPNQEGIGEGGGKTPRRFRSYVYIISHPRVIPTPKGPYKTGGTLSKSASEKFQKSDKKTVLCWSCLSSADGQSSFTFLFPLVLSGARNTRQARRAQRRGITWASKRTSEQRRARL